VFLLADNAAVPPEDGSDLPGSRLIQRVKRNEPAADLKFVAVSGLLAVARLWPRLRQTLPAFLGPVRPAIWKVEIEEQCATGLEMPIEVIECLLVLVSCATETEGAADNDGPVCAGKMKIVKGLLEEAGRESFGSCSLFAELEHVWGDIRAVYVEARSEVGDE
jgi:hypothetical protein